MKYFAMIEGERRGPYGLDELAEAGVRPSTYVWCKGMADWEQAADVPDICRMWRNRLHDMMHLGSRAAFSRDVPDVRPAENPNPDVPEIPTVSQIDESRTPQAPPRWLMGAAVGSLLFFFPTAVIAVVSARSAHKLWQAGAEREADDAARHSMMMSGISFFLGLVVWPFVLRMIMQ